MPILVADIADITVYRGTLEHLDTGEPEATAVVVEVACRLAAAEAFDDGPATCLAVLKGNQRRHDVTRAEQLEQMTQKGGFIAALDQSGGSTPGALRAYGIPDSAYSSDHDMFQLIHAMRVRIMTSPAFIGGRIIGAILFEATMDGSANGEAVPSFLASRGVVPFLKVDKGLDPDNDGVSLMKPISGLDALLDRAAKLGVFGTKMRSVITLASEHGIAAAVAQQFALAKQIIGHGLMPIIEPEVSIKSPDKASAEAILLDQISKQLDALPPGSQVMLKLTIPDVTDHYVGLTRDDRVARVVALSGGYTRKEACRRLATNHGVIASFSRALIADLNQAMSDDEFNSALATAIAEIYRASIDKQDA